MNRTIVDGGAAQGRRVQPMTQTPDTSHTTTKDSLFWCERCRAVPPAVLRCVCRALREGKLRRHSGHAYPPRSSDLGTGTTTAGLTTDRVPRVLPSFDAAFSVKMTTKTRNGRPWAIVLGPLHVQSLHNVGCACCMVVPVMYTPRTWKKWFHFGSEPNDAMF